VNKSGAAVCADLGVSSKYTKENFIVFVGESGKGFEGNFGRPSVSRS